VPAAAGAGRWHRRPQVVDGVLLVARVGGLAGGRGWPASGLVVGAALLRLRRLVVRAASRGVAAAVLVALPATAGLGWPPPCAPVLVDAKSALNANHTASRAKLASHAQRADDVPVNFS
jgi:hypothetical protein